MTLSDSNYFLQEPTNELSLSALGAYLIDTINSGEISEKRELLDFLSKFLAKFAKDIAEKFPEIYDQLQTGWLQLAFSGLVGLPSEDQDNLFQKRLLAAIQKGVEPETITKQFYSFFESEEFIKELFHHFAQDLEQNTESLGSLPIEVEGRRMLPSVKYWILDYSKFPSKEARRGAVERLNYLTQSPNVRQLTQGQRQTLSKILKLYDDFLSGELSVAARNQQAQSANSRDVEGIRVQAEPIRSPQVDIQKKLEELKRRQ